jgi:serine/threonine protein kinase/WD40 repeat protein
MTEEELFHQTLAKAGNERASFLDAACQGDMALRKRIEALLQAHSNPRSFWSDAVAEPSTDRPTACGSETAVSIPRERSGGQISSYKLLQLLGEGGMGEVWMAEQTEPVRRQVALKLIKPGMDSRSVLARFEAERQALALMDHPNIARVLDAGTSTAEWLTPGADTTVCRVEGRPYFVMELVKGIPITRFCDEHRLGVRERIELFVTVCQAVLHAHQKGIIHRDLKPTNVLVALYDGRAVPKVIDFGIAKATAVQLTDKTLFTGFGSVVGTPEYMSPEQAEFNQLDIDTRSDIYSLGVLLYELLTGTTPLDRERARRLSVLELLRLVREEEPQRPSDRLSTTAEAPTVAGSRSVELRKLSGVVRGELDWIVMKCLEKDRNRRYETASALVRDLERYLQDETVQARPPSVGYRLRKFARRNKWPLATAAAILVGLFATIGMLTYAVIQGDGKQKALQSALTAEQNTAAIRESALQQELKQKDSQQHLSYVMTVALAHRGGEGARVEQVRPLLDSCSPERRGWEWSYLDRLSRGGPPVLRVSAGIPGIARAISRDGSLTALASSEDGSRRHHLQVWESATGREVLALRDLAAYPKSIALSADARQLAFTDGLHVEVREVATGKEILSIPADGLKSWTGKTIFSPDGRRLLTWKDTLPDGSSQIVIWDLASGKQVVSFPAPDNHAAFSSSGRRLAVMGSDFLEVYDITAGNLVVRFDMNKGTSLVGVPAFPDDDHVVGVEKTGIVRSWDLNARREGSPVRVPGLPLGLSADGRYVVTSWDGVRVWEAATGKEVRAVRRLSLNPGGLLSEDGWHLLVPLADGVQCLDLNKDRATVCQLSFQDIPLTTAAGRAELLTVGPDGRWAAAETEPGVVRVWDAATGQAVQTLRGHKGKIKHMAFHPDGVRLATASHDGTVRLWDTPAGREAVTLTGHDQSARWVGFSRDGTTLASVDGRSVLRHWDSNSGRELGRFQLPHPRQTAGPYMFDFDGRRVVTVGPDERIRVWEVATGESTWSASWGDRKARVRCIALSPDGRFLAGWGQSAADQPWLVLRLWDAATGREIEPAPGRLGGGDLIAFSPDGRLLAGAGGTGVTVYDVTSGLEILNLRITDRRSETASCLRFTADGHRLILATGDGAVTVWDGTPLKPELKSMP